MKSFLLLLLVACAHPQSASLELVESWPIETTLGHDDIPDAHEVWPVMIARARRRLDVCAFYVSDDLATSRLTPTLDAILAAADRGVAVRILVDAAYAEEVPETLPRLEGHPGVALRRYDVAHLTGGVQHAKYFIVDGEEAYLGSQNLDWRSLTHIQELGVRMRGAALVRPLADVFAADWARAGGEPLPEAHPQSPTRVGGLRVTLVASPRGWLPDESWWELPRMVSMIQDAKTSVRLQALTYEADVPALEAALRAAGARGVKVEVLVSDWNLEKNKVDGLKALARAPGIAVRLVTIPEWSGGFVPYARVIHSKIVAVDGERAWMGSSNVAMGYFTEDRNVGLLVVGATFARRLERVFDEIWDSSYARTVDPDADYEAPRFRE